MTTRFNQPQAPQKAGGHPRHRHDGKQASTFFAPAVSSVAVLSADARLFSAIGFHIGGCWIAFLPAPLTFSGSSAKEWSLLCLSLIRTSSISGCRYESRFAMEQARTDSSTAITYCSRASMRIQGLPAKSCQAESACIFASSYIADAPEGATVEAARDREVRRRRHTVTDTRALSREALATMGQANGGNGVIETIIASAEDLTVSRTDLTPARATLAPSQDGSKPPFPRHAHKQPSPRLSRPGALRRR